MILLLVRKPFAISTFTPHHIDMKGSSLSKAMYAIRFPSGGHAGVPLIAFSSGHSL